MIENFKDMEMRKSGVVYSSTLEQIKKLYAADPEKAGELAISAIELVLCGGISSTDMMIELMLEPAKTMVERDKDKYDMKVQTAKEKKMYEQKLDRIAELYKQGLKQRDIGERLGLSQQIISRRMAIIKTEYPELLAEE
jgi:DNA-binding NarL/FixJ family response regulator